MSESPEAAIKFTDTTLGLSARLEHIWHARPSPISPLTSSWLMLWRPACRALLAHLQSASHRTLAPPFAVAVVMEHDRAFRNNTDIDPYQINPHVVPETLWRFYTMEGYRLPPADPLLAGPFLVLPFYTPEPANSGFSAALSPFRGPTPYTPRVVATLDPPQQHTNPATPTASPISPIISSTAGIAHTATPSAPPPAPADPAGMEVDSGPPAQPGPGTTSDPALPDVNPLVPKDPRTRKVRRLIIHGPRPQVPVNGLPPQTIPRGRSKGKEVERAAGSRKRLRSFSRLKNREPEPESDSTSPRPHVPKKVKTVTSEEVVSSPRTAATSSRRKESLPVDRPLEPVPPGPSEGDPSIPLVDLVDANQALPDVWAWAVCIPSLSLV